MTRIKKPIHWKRLIRQVHYWISLVILIPCGIMIMAGIVLMLKKQIHWVQSPTLSSHMISALPNPLNLNQALNHNDHDHNDHGHGFTLGKVKKIDIRPNKGIAKVIYDTGWEEQIDLGNGNILSLKKRRSDWIESIHDGSFFGEPVKTYLFLPTGILLLFMWASGIYLFLLPYLTRAAKRKKNRS